MRDRRLAVCVVLLCLTIGAPALGQPRFGLFDWLDEWMETGRPTIRDEDEDGAHTGTPTYVRQPFLSAENEAGLKSAIARYEAVARAGGWRPIPKGRYLRYGDTGRAVDLLRMRLMASDDLRKTSGSYGFDARMTRALKRFQLRHGLKPTGVVYRRTRDALNVTANTRLLQLRRNLERLRALRNESGHGRYILVNIPSYDLQAVSGGKVELYSRVVVGKPSTSTPVLKASVRAINLLPYWHVPESIARRALLPRLRKDPDYLRRQHFQVYSSWGGQEIDPRTVNWKKVPPGRYVFRQKPGPWNALGLVRIDIPNKHIVYLHDTPLKKLYHYNLRAYSAGCVRVQSILTLSNWLLDGHEGWSMARIEQAVKRRRQHTVNLPNTVPVRLAYLSAFAAKDGTIHFRRDIYGRDGVGRAAVAGAPAPSNAEKEAHTAAGVLIHP